MAKNHIEAIITKDDFTGHYTAKQKVFFGLWTTEWFMDGEDDIRAKSSTMIENVELFLKKIARQRNCTLNITYKYVNNKMTVKVY